MFLWFTFLFTFFGGDYERIFVTLEDLIYHWFSSKASINGRIFPLPPPSLEWQILMLPWIWQEENILNYSSHVKYIFECKSRLGVLNWNTRYFALISYIEHMCLLLFQSIFNAALMLRHNVWILLKCKNVLCEIVSRF